MQFTTPIKDYGHTFLLNEDDNILSLGSCYAQVIGQRMAERKLHVLLNPMGMLYNPRSIFQTIDTAMKVTDGQTTAQNAAGSMVFEAADQRWYCWLASSKISGKNREECIGNMAAALEETSRMLISLDVLMLTFGTDHYYTTTLQEGKEVVVANCHKMPANMFCEKTMTTEDIAGIFDCCLRRLISLRPKLRVIVTISPYRYLKYGLHNSQLSKSRLLLATNTIANHYQQVHYFPAYEIMNDELRDYRFYAADMVHPSDVAEQYIWQQFCTNYMDTQMQMLMAQREKELKTLAHKPINN